MAPRRHVTWLVFVLAITIFAAPTGAHAQGPTNRTPLDPAVLQAVDRMYPGFTEVLEQPDAANLGQLARTLSEHPSPESLAVLVWMLRYCQSWSTDRESQFPQIDKTILAVGMLPVASLTDALLHATVDQRVTAAALLGKHDGLISDTEKLVVEKQLRQRVHSGPERKRFSMLARFEAVVDRPRVARPKAAIVSIERDGI